MTDDEKAAAEAAAAAAAKAAEGKTFTQADVDALLAGLKAKNAELLGETKAERAKREALEATQAEAEAERQKKAGEYQALYDGEAAKRKETEQALSELRGTIAKNAVESAANGVASELTRDTKRAALIAKEVAAFAKHGENGITYEIAGVTVDRAKVIETITADYPFLVDGNGSTGGGANGGSGGAATKKLADMTTAERADLQAKDPQAFRQMVAEAKQR
jgi:pyruvate/2-oxoglutarate dehydrogenase complex dihydrolipoamide acyltransferase (E2) component